MAKLTRDERLEIAKTRLLRVLGAHNIATMRTLEMKISDAGPFNQRIDPHILTDARKQLKDEGQIQSVRPSQSEPPWFFLGNTSTEQFPERFDTLRGLQRSFAQKKLIQRTGQALEIAVYRTLTAAEHTFFGNFPDLEKHNDHTLYTKHDPPRHIGKRLIPDSRLLDFIVQHNGLWAGIECKNVREWLYPERKEVKELFDKALYLDCVPVLIARRIHPSTFLLYNKCGLIVHQTYNQRLANADVELATKAADKTLLSYFDIRVGNEPDERLTKFLTINLPKVLPEAREKWNEYNDLIFAYCREGMSYEEFAARIRRRYDGTNEDGDWDAK